MKIELIVAIIGGIFIPLITYFLSKSTNSEKKYLIKKFQENKIKLSEVISDLEGFMNENRSWDQQAFADSPIKLKEYHQRITEQYLKEYSEEQFNAINKSKLSKLEFKEYIGKLKVQEDSLNLLSTEIKFKNYR